MKEFLLVIFCLLVILIPCCTPEIIPAQTQTPIGPELQQTSVPLSSPTPTQKLDEPGMSQEEMAAYVWKLLPDSLPGSYAKSQFESETKNAVYIGNNKWEFSLRGGETQSKSLPLRRYEKTPGNWVENYSNQVYTYNLELKAIYYETTNTLDIIDIQKSDEDTKIETVSEIPIIAKKFKVDWIRGEVSGVLVRIEGSVTNIGIIPIENATIEVALFDLEGNLIRTDTAPLKPNKIDVYGSGNFFLEVMQSLKAGKYRHKLHHRK